MQVNKLKLLIMLIGATLDLGKSEPESGRQLEGDVEISLPAQAAGRVEMPEQDRSWGKGLTKSAEHPRVRALRFWTIRGRGTVGFGMRMRYAKLQGWAEQNLLKVSLKTVVLQLGLRRINNLLIRI